MNSDYLSRFLSGVQNPALFMTHTGEVIQCNQAFLDLYNVSTAVFLNKNYFDVCRQHELEPIALSLETLLNPSMPLTSSFQQDSSLPITIQWVTSAIKNETGIEGIFFMGCDISHVVNASTQEKEIKKSIIDYIPNHYIFWKDINSVYLGCNQALADAMQLASSKDIIGKTDYDLKTTKEQSSAYCADDKEVMLSKIPKLNIEEQQTLPDGSERVLLTSKVPLFDEKGHVYGVLGIYSDITERKNMQIALEKAKNQAETANSAKTEFITNMSHDLRTPLSGMIGLSKLLEESSEHPEEKKYARWINESGDELLRLLNGILDVVSADNVSENDVHEELFNLHQFIQDIIHLELPTTKLKKLDLNVSICPDVPTYIISDRTKLHRVLLNLVGNAIKFTDSGSISLSIKSLKRSGDEANLQFSVSDTGIGIPQKLQDKVFDRFYRSTPSYKGTYPGNGVGLHIARSYVNLLGGHLALTSQEGVGTTFYFDLTCKIGHENVELASKEFLKPSMLTSTWEFSTKPHLLLVEDNAIALKMAEAMVSKAGYQCTTASDGEQALKLTESLTFDLIITDLGLPGISGHEFARGVRKEEGRLGAQPLPIIGLTAHTQEHAKQECLEAGMNDVFTKPMTQAMLQTIVNQWITPVSHQNSNPLKLGVDLPDTEEELLKLEMFPVLNIKNAIESLGNENMLHEILVMLNNDIHNDSKIIEAAYQEKNWETIEKLAHKLKGSALYCGTLKMKYACQYLERYQKAGHTHLLNELYHQLMQVLKETQHHINAWLQEEKKTLVPF